MVIFLYYLYIFVWIQHSYLAKMVLLWIDWMNWSLQTSQPIRVMSSRSVYLTTLFLGRLSPLSSQPVFLHVLSPENDNCPSWISGRDKMTVEKISWSISTNECCRIWQGSNLQPPNHQSVAHLTEPPMSAFTLDPSNCVIKKLWCTDLDVHLI